MAVKISAKALAAVKIGQAARRLDEALTAIAAEDSTTALDKACVAAEDATQAVEQLSRWDHEQHRAPTS